MLYLENDEAYEQILEDYEDQAQNEPIRHKRIRRVKTPVESIEEIKNSKTNYLRTSGSYSIESLRNNQNTSLMFSRIDPACNQTNYSNNVSKFNDHAYMKKLKKKDFIKDKTANSNNDDRVNSPYLNKVNQSQK